MGEILQAACPCGYQVEDLFVGCGMSGPGRCRDLAVCRHGGTLTTVRSQAARKRCRTCRRKLIVIPEETLAAEGLGIVIDCPRCAQQSLGLSGVGSSD
jgi:hypothetical protein